MTGSGLTTNLDTVLALMADVLMNPSFPQAEVDRYKTRSRAELHQPADAARASSRRSGSTGRCSAITRRRACRRRLQALDALTRDALVEFHKTHYIPDRAVLAVAGDISLAQAKSKAEAAFGAWKKSGAAISRDARVRPPPAAPDDLVRRAAQLGADEPSRRHAEHRRAPIPTTTP